MRGAPNSSDLSNCGNTAWDFITAAQGRHGLSRMSIPSESDREGVTRRIDWPGRIVRSERIL
jgi:hypothetical protein